METRSFYYMKSKAGRWTMTPVLSVVILLFTITGINATPSKDHSVTVVTPDTLSDVWDGVKRKSGVYQYYLERRFELSWFNQNDHKLSPLADSFLTLVRDIRSRGLIPYHYHLDDAERFQKQFLLFESRDRIDLMLTDAFLLLVHDIQYGRINRHTLADDTRGIQVLQNVMSYGKLGYELYAMEPRYRAYRELIMLLKDVLGSVKGDLRIQLDRGFFPGQLSESALIRTIDINLERWRQETADFRMFHVLVNLPSFRLEAGTDDSIYFSSPVIVGKKHSPTPLLSSYIDCMVVFPYWHVPRKITVGEYLPFLKKDSLFLERNMFDLLDGQGEIVDASTIDFTPFTARTFPYTLRQREGTDNSLGILKFVFDNPYAVYLHDTNTKASFRHSDRALSHGCVRVEKALGLGHLLRTGKIQATDPVLEKAIRKRIRLSLMIHPVPLYIRYFTIEVNDAGYQAYADIYSQDRDMLAKLYPPVFVQ